MFNFTRTPPEIWEEIFRLACTDGGYTGRSLALTTTSFNTYSFRVRFRTLAFTSLLQLQQFLDVLSRHGSARMEHLYLSFTDDPGPGQYPQRGEMGAVMSVLRAGAPTLRTLCVVSRCSCGFLLRPPPCEFLLLEELSWMGVHSPLLLDHPTTLGADADSAGTAGRVVYPVLKRVHCVVENAAYAGQVVAKLTELASASLTHLRISALDRRASDVPDVLERVLGMHGEAGVL